MTATMKIGLTILELALLWVMFSGQPRFPSQPDLTVWGRIKSFLKDDRGGPPHVGH